MIHRASVQLSVHLLTLSVPSSAREKRCVVEHGGRLCATVLELSHILPCEIL